MWKLVLIPFWLAWFKCSCYMWPYCDVVVPVSSNPTLSLAPSKLMAHRGYLHSLLAGWCWAFYRLNGISGCSESRLVTKSRTCQSTGKTRSTSEPQVLLWKLKRETLDHQHCLELYGKILDFPLAHWTTDCYKDWSRERFTPWSQMSPGGSWFSAWYGSVWLYSCRGFKEQGLVKILAALSLCVPSQAHSVQVSFTIRGWKAVFACPSPL